MRKPSYALFLCPPPLLTITPFPHLNAPLSAAVESDTVGYTTIEITQDFALLGVSFMGLTPQSETTMPINEFLDGTFVEGDQIQVLNPETQQYEIAAWNAELSLWCTSRRGSATTTPSPVVLTLGDAIWLKTSATTEKPIEITAKGRVCTAALEYKLGNRYQLLSFPAFESLAVNSPKLTWTGLKHGDQLQVLGPNGQYEIAAWNAELNLWTTSRRGNPTTTPSTLEIPGYSGAWFVSSGENAMCSFDITK